ncbi:MAG: site-specific integrase [Planctomycetes bacterium]|nr:site-specific integrase [Planctomycetota bacterium]
MAPRSTRTVARIETIHGFVGLRGLWAAKQGSMVIILTGTVPALRIVLPTWRPRSPGKTGLVRVQITPEKRISTIDGINKHIESLVPDLRARAVAASNAFTVSGSSPPAPASYTTLGEVIDLVQREITPTVRSISARTYHRQYESILRRLPADTPLRDLTRARLQELISTLVSEHLSPSTIKNLSIGLNRVLTRAVEDGVLERSPFARVKTPKSRPSQRLVLTKPQRDHLIQVAARDSRDMFLLLSVALLCGLRRGELLNLTWQDVDLKAKVLHVRNTPTFKTKSGYDRTVPLCSQLLTIFSKYRRPSGYVIKPLHTRPGPNRWCFQRSWDRVVAAAGFPTFLLHGCRHTFSTLAARSGVSPVKLSAWLGHASAKGVSKTTAGYIHLSDSYDHDIEVAAAG